MDNNQEKNIKDILDIVVFIKDNAATKEDLNGFATKKDLERFATKEDLERFATKEDLDEKLAPIKQQLANIELELKDIRQELAKLGKLEAEDIGASYKDIEVLKKRVDELEIKLAKMQSAAS